MEHYSTKGVPITNLLNLSLNSYLPCLIASDPYGPPELISYLWTKAVLLNYTQQN